MRTINIAFNIALLFGFSTLFILEIHNLINKLNETNDRLNYIATHDALTGLYNRHSLTGALSALKTSERPFCIVMGDLDDFKKVNDTYGHECGDVVLKSVSEVILRNMAAGTPPWPLGRRGDPHDNVRHRDGLFPHFLPYKSPDKQP